MEAHYTLAEAGDYGELIDFCNYVFSHAHSPTDFPALLPKLYRPENFTPGCHYIVREGGRIRAAVGAYPLCLNVLGTALPARGIGMVSVHPYARARGYMRALMKMALEDMRRDGIVFSLLGGQRQRYEYFGYTPAGQRAVFECCRANIRHLLGKGFSPAFSVRRLEGDGKELEDIYLLHQSKAARFERDAGKLFEILSSWKCRVFTLSDGGGFAGYLVADSAGAAISEINLKNPARMIEAAGCFLNHLGRDQVSVDVQPWETEKLEAFSAFAENCRVTAPYSFAVFDWQPLLSALLRLKTASGQDLPDGEAFFRVSREGLPDSCFRIAVRQGEAEVSPGTGEGAIALDSLRAARLFFSPQPWAPPALLGSPFLRGILPLPLFFENPDGI
ncbi:MAG: GNAT family N-acetyltransferase [Treponema sp.]|jgi:predicted N-acetyltransferase YhbS|nr:GNAT family N-acetyltransferase [Treponema sp.]